MARGVWVNVMCMCVKKTQNDNKENKEKDKNKNKENSEDSDEHISGSDSTLPDSSSSYNNSTYGSSRENQTGSDAAHGGQ